MARFVIVLLIALAGISACERKADERKGPPPALISVAEAKVTRLEITEETLGSLEAVVDPQIGAEVAGRVVQVLARAGDKVKKGQLLALLDPTDLTIQTRSDAAELRRLEALLAQQERLVERQKNLVRRGFISQNAVDDTTAQRDALRAQLAVARAKADAGDSNLRKTRVLAPVDGAIEVQIVAPGDYVKIGDPLFRLVSNTRLRVHLPFPETAAARMKRGLRVRITSPQAPGYIVDGVIEDIRPTVTQTSRALDVIARFSNEGGLLSGGTVNAAVLVETKERAVVVPEQSVVLRPAGKVVYLVSDGKARQQLVETGAKRDGVVEILNGLTGGETVALDGAGFLSDNAAVSIQQAAAPQSAKSTAAPQDKAAGDTPIKRAPGT